MQTAQPKSQTVPVTADNFIRAETDKTFAGFEKQGFGKFEHFRELAPIDNQIVQRGNRDTLYSMGVFDLDAGPVTISLPDAGKRFMTMIVINEDHYVSTVVYGTGTYTLIKKITTRYALAGIRILVDPNDPNDVAQVHALQDAVKVSWRAMLVDLRFPTGIRKARRRCARRWSCWVRRFRTGAHWLAES